MAWEETRFASDGDLCVGRLHRAAAERAPCVVLGTGFSCVRDQGLDQVAARFAAAGFHALAFDYRHSGESGGEPRGLVHPALQRADLLAAVRFARGIDGVDPDAVALWGYSFGGGHVLSLAASGAPLAAAICVAPVVDTVRSLLHIGGARHLARMLAAGARDRLRGARGAAPYEIAAAGPPGSLAVLSSADSVPGFEAITGAGSSWRNEVWARPLCGVPYALRRRARRIEAPLLVCVTSEDDVNPPALGAEVATRAPRGELRRYPGGHFDPLHGETLERMAADQVEFLSRALPS